MGIMEFKPFLTYLEKDVILGKLSYFLIINI